MGVVVLVAVVLVVVGGATIFFRAVFGGSTFRGRRDRGAEHQGGPPRPRPDGHLGANRPSGGGGVGGTDSWAGGDWG